MKSLFGNQQLQPPRPLTDRVQQISISLLLVRLFLALVIFPHGAQKLAGWFGGYGFQGNMKYFTETMHLPWIIGFIVIIIEFFGPLSIIAGWATRFWSFAIACVMTGVILTNYTEHFFMNWFGKQSSEGMEFFLLAIGMSLSLTVAGAGRFSIDQLFSKKIALPKGQLPGSHAGDAALR